MSEHEYKSLRSIRKAKLMSLEQLSEISGKGSSTLSDLEIRERDGRVLLKK